MPEIVISDTSCLILLRKIDQLFLLSKIYGKVTVTPVIAKEFGLDLPEFVEVREPKDQSLFRTLTQLVDQGEASAFTLAFEIDNCVLILDDRKARRVAKSLGFKMTGTLGLLVKAKQDGVLPEIKPLLAKLKETDFRISEKVITKILEQAGEK
jgi:predicted nucleic acid-binding protein